MSSSSSASSNTSSSLSSDFNPDTSQDSDLVYNFNRKTYVQFPGQDKILINTDHIEFDRAYEKDPITGKITPKNWGKDEQIPDIETPELQLVMILRAMMLSIKWLLISNQ